MRKTAISIVAALAWLCPGAHAQANAWDALLAKAATWNYDQDRGPLRAITVELQKAQASAAQTRDIERRFLAFLQSGATTASKDFICRQLGVIGSEASVPARRTWL